MDLDFVSVHKNVKREFSQYPAILTLHLVNNICVIAVFTFSLTSQLIYSISTSIKLVQYSSISDYDLEAGFFCSSEFTHLDNKPSANMMPKIITYRSRPKSIYINRVPVICNEILDGKKNWSRKLSMMSWTKNESSAKKKILKSRFKSRLREDADQWHRGFCLLCAGKLVQCCRSMLAFALAIFLSWSTMAERDLWFRHYDSGRCEIYMGRPLSREEQSESSAKSSEYAA